MILSSNDFKHFALYSKASKEKKFECFRLLVEAGADIEAETKLGARPIMLAVQGGDLEIVKYCNFVVDELQIADCTKGDH
jgi:hypothetical protein